MAPQSKRKSRTSRRGATRRSNRKSNRRRSRGQRRFKGTEPVYGANIDRDEFDHMLHSLQTNPLPREPFSRMVQRVRQKIVELGVEAEFQEFGDDDTALYAAWKSSVYPIRQELEAINGRLSGDEDDLVRLKLKESAIELMDDFELWKKFKLPEIANVIRSGLEREHRWEQLIKQKEEMIKENKRKATELTETLAKIEAQ